MVDECFINEMEDEDARRVEEDLKAAVKKYKKKKKTAKDLDDARKDTEQKMSLWRKQYKDFVDTAPAREEKRNQFEELTGQASMSASKAAELSAGQYDFEASTQQALADAEELRKRESRQQMMRGNRGGGYGLNSEQRIGTYAATPPGFKEALDDLKAIRHNTAHLNPKPHIPGNRRTSYSGTPGRQ